MKYLFIVFAFLFVACSEPEYTMYVDGNRFISDEYGSHVESNDFSFKVVLVKVESHPSSGSKIYTFAMDLGDGLEVVNYNKVMFNYPPAHISQVGDVLFTFQPR